MSKREVKIQGLGRIKFEVLERKLKVGDFINGEEVADIKELGLMAEFPAHSDDGEFRYFQYHTTFNQEPDDDPEDKYYCIYVGIEEFTQEEEEIIEDAIDFLTTTEAGLQDSKAEELKRNVNLYANDYILSKYEELDRATAKELIEEVEIRLSIYWSKEE